MQELHYPVTGLNDFSSDKDCTSLFVEEEVNKNQTVADSDNSLDH